MKDIFVSENDYYEVMTEDYGIENEVSNEVWQEFADRLGEEFKSIDDKRGTDEFEDLWNDAHDRVCREFPQIFG